jgi:16S rRNA (uracil1498-N3)-methyltransferase
VKQFILNKIPDAENLVRLKNKDYRYLVRVKRLACGEYFPALLPDGEQALVQVLSIDRGILTGKCTPSKKNSMTTDKTEDGTAAEKQTAVVLLQALPKGEKMDLIVRQAAESGISRIVPFISEFSLVKKFDAKGQKFSRWQKIIKEARQQSGSAINTTVVPPLTIDELFKHWDTIHNNDTLGLLFHHQNIGLGKTTLHGCLVNVPKIAVLAVGPEGGFSDNEVSRFLEAGFKPLTIGDTILRTETAALFCAAALRTVILERDAWEPKQTN